MSEEKKNITNCYNNMEGICFITEQPCTQEIGNECGEKTNRR